MLLLQAPAAVAAVADDAAAAAAASLLRLVVLDPAPAAASQPVAEVTVGQCVAERGNGGQTTHKTAPEDWTRTLLQLNEHRMSTHLFNCALPTAELQKANAAIECHQSIVFLPCLFLYSLRVSVCFSSFFKSMLSCASRTRAG